MVRFASKTPVETLVLQWDPALCQGLGVVSGESAFLPFFEALTALAAIEVWGGQLQSFALVGDNIGALTAAVSTRGRGDLARVCREMALRQALQGAPSIGGPPTQ